MSTLGEIGEHEAIRRLVKKLGDHSDLTVGAGDDCAVCRIPGTGSDQVFTTDPIVEGVHFLSGETPERVGHKAVGRALSDIAAMGAVPQWVLVNVVAPPQFDMGYLERVYDGMNALCERFGAVVIGGDLAKGPVFELHIFGTGLLPSGKAMLRSGARVGDSIFVTGPLGGSLAGKHLDFIPRINEGIFLRETGLIHAAMDISDGLATDLRHILSRSGVGAELMVENIPGNGTLNQALFDGEDFELVLTASAADSDMLQAAWNQRFFTDLFEIGQIIDEPSVLRIRQGGDSKVIETKAFEHFSS